MSGQDQPGAAEQPVSALLGAEYLRGARDALRVMRLTQAVARGSFRTGLKDYPVCMSDGARAAKAELESLCKADSALGRQDGQLRDGPK